MAKHNFQHHYLSLHCHMVNLIGLYSTKENLGRMKFSTKNDVRKKKLNELAAHCDILKRTRMKNRSSYINFRPKQICLK